MNSLGIQFCIPEYNASLHQRAQQSPRPTTSYMPLSDVMKPATRPVTHSVVTRPIVNNQSLSRNTKTFQQRGIGGIQRSNTYAPKMFSETPPIVTETYAQRNQTKSVPKLNTMSDDKQSKSKFSLPPIGLDLKYRSMTISHF